MRADDAAYKKRIHLISREALEDECFRQKQDADHNRILYEESQKSLTEASKDYRKVVEERDDLKSECLRLQMTIQHMENSQTLGNRDRFGSKGESLDGLISSPENPENPTDEDSSGEEQADSGKPSGGIRSRALALANPDNNKKKGGRNKKGPSLQDLLKRLPYVVDYELDPAALDKVYGEFGWVIAYWHSHYKVEERRVVRYVRIIKTAVLSIKHGAE